MSAKKLFEKSNFHDNIKENKLLSCSPNIIEGFKEVQNTYYLKYDLLIYIFFTIYSYTYFILQCYDIKTNVKFGRFIMKKRSHISRKFEKSVKNSE